MNGLKVEKSVCPNFYTIIENEGFANVFLVDYRHKMIFHNDRSIIEKIVK